MIRFSKSFLVLGGFKGLESELTFEAVGYFLLQGWGNKIDLSDQKEALMIK